MEATQTAAQERLREISCTLVGARRAAKALPGFPGKLPTTFADAYAIQDISRQSWDDEVVGWKVGGVPPDFIAHFGQTHLVGPIFSKSVKYVSDQGGVSMPMFEHGFAAVEPELILQLGETASQDRLFIGAEIASSPLPAINDIGPIAVISDFGNNNGLVIGPEIVEWQKNGIEPVVVECTIDGECVGRRDISETIAGVNTAREFLLSHAQKAGMELAAGTYISTGAITGIHEVTVGAHAKVAFGTLGAFSVTLEAATAI